MYMSYVALMEVISIFVGGVKHSCKVEYQLIFMQTSIFYIDD